MQRVKMIFWNLSGLFSYEDTTVLKALLQDQKGKNSSDLLQHKVLPNYIFPTLLLLYNLSEEY